MSNLTFLLTTLVLGLLGLVTYVGLVLVSWASPKPPPLPQPARTGKKNTYSKENPEIIVIGAGVVGATIAVQFGKQGRHCVVIERSMEAPSRIVGEFLQPAGYKSMQILGVAGTINLLN